MTLASHDAATLAETVAQRCQHAAPVHNGWQAACPAHEDDHPSLSITPTADRVLLRCHAGCTTAAVVTALGMTMADLFIHSAAPRNGQKRIVKTYDYQNAHGTLLHQTVRYEPKDFRQRRPDPAKPGQWIWSLQGIEPVLYHLPQILQAVQGAETIFLGEGEKDTENLQALGLAATCNPMGAGKWRQSYTETLRGAAVVILPDNDEPGRKHADLVARSLHGVAASVKVLALPGLPEKGDVSDWLHAGGTRETLETLVRATPVWSPEADQRTEASAPGQSLPPWPQMATEAYYGLAGDIVRAIDPYSEADPVAVLLNILVGVGNAIGPTPHARVQHDHHPARLNAIQVGESSKGRKGTGWSTPRHLLAQADDAWAGSRVKSGLSSGEGLIYNVRDALSKREPVKEKGRVVDYQDVEVDPGETDKRLLIVEPEFASALTVMAREGNILSAVIRQAWDDGTLSPLTRNNPMTATGAHISIIGHITRDELLARLDDTSKANGFANRFLWVLVRRSKLLPRGEAAPDQVLRPLVERLQAVFTFARTDAHLQRDAKAEAVWEAVYGPLSEGKPGLLGAIISRAEAQVLRLSVLYTLLDCSTTIKVEHLIAALAVWQYCEDSARLIFGERLGDPTADRILEAIRTAGASGMTDNDIYELFGRHKSANERARALTTLVSLGLVRDDKEETGGRPRTVWRAA